MQVTPGTLIGPYEITVRLGAGGMGEVYRAHDTKLGRDVALKILPVAFAGDADRLQRFEREARALAALNHPNIAQVFGLEQTDGVRAIAMELVEGPTLAEVRVASTREALTIAGQIAAALEAAHDHGIIHRDLKPANVKVRDDGTVKVLDFGLAKALDPAASGDSSDNTPTVTSPATGLGVILGTPAYMSPEQARGRGVDRRADIWALGVVLFELLTARRLFVGDTVSDAIASVLRQEIPWDRLPGDTPPRVRRLLERCLEREPRQRLRDAGDARLELEDVIARPSESEPAAAAVTPRRSMAFERGGWIALLFAGIAATWWFSRSAPVAVDPGWSRFTQLTDEAGAEDTPAISPDGDFVAYARRTGNSWDILTRRIGGRTVTVVAGDPNRHESAPAFSPDGRFIAFHESDADGGIFVVGATGESVRRLTQAGFHPAWSPSGREIVFCEERVWSPFSRAATSAISIVEVATGTVREIFAGDGVQPQWSPSGAQLVFWSTSAGRRDIFTMPAAGGKPVRITSDDALNWYPTWAPDGRFVYFASDRGGTFNLWRVAVDEHSGAATGPPEPVTGGVYASFERPTFSKDGTRLVFRSNVTAVNPAVIPLDPNAERIGEPRILFERSGVLVPTSVSPDGQLLALCSFGAATEDIFLSRIDGSGLTRLTDDQFRDRMPVWSSDGTQLVFYSNRVKDYNLWRIRADGSGLTQITNRPSAVWFPFFESGNQRVWAFDAAGLHAFTVNLADAKLPTAGEDQPRIPVEGGTLRPYGMSRDRKKLIGLVVSPEGTRVGVGWHDLRSGKTVSVRDTASLTPPAWLPDGRRAIYFANEQELVVIDTETSRRQVIGGRLPFSVNTSAIALAPNGRAVFVGMVNAQSDIWMVERGK